MDDQVTVTIDQESSIHELLVMASADIATGAKIATTNGGWRLVGRDDVYATLHDLVADLITAGCRAKLP